VQDYCQLNSLTIKNQYPLPLISDVINKLKDACTLTKFDVHWGYNNVCIKPSDEWKAAFKTNHGMFEPLDPIQSLKLSAMGTLWVQNTVTNRDLADGHHPIMIVHPPTVAFRQPPEHFVAFHTDVSIDIVVTIKPFSRVLLHFY